MKKYKISENWLIEQYIQNNKTRRQIAKEIGCSDVVIKRRLKEFNIKKSVELIRKLYQNENNPNYKDGRTLKKYYCKCEKEINYNNALYGNGKCITCFNKKIHNLNCQCAFCKGKRGEYIGKNNPFYRKKHTQKTKRKIGKSNKNRPDVAKKISQIRIKKGLAKGKNNPNWNNGSSFEPYPLEWNRAYKEQIRERDNYTCQVCGCPETGCLQKLHVHHIDYNKKNIDPINLISLCQFCHMKTNYNRDYYFAYFMYMIGKEIEL